MFCGYSTETSKFSFPKPRKSIRKSNVFSRENRLDLLGMDDYIYNNINNKQNNPQNKKQHEKDHCNYHLPERRKNHCQHGGKK